MPCVPIDIPTIPPFPTGFGYGPPDLPAVSAEANICCRFALFAYTPPPLFPPGTVNSAFLVAVNAFTQAARTWIDLLPVKCPKNPI